VLIVSLKCDLPETTIKAAVSEIPGTNPDKYHKNKT